MSDDQRVVVKSELECWDEPTPVCPYCGYKEKEQDIANLLGYSIDTVLLCMSCNSEYLVEVEAKTVFSTTPMEGWGGVRVKKAQASDGGLH